MGDYSRTIPTFNIELKKLLLSRFNIIQVNYIIKKRKHVKHLHQVLTPKDDTWKRIYINRDVNACKNIKLITKTYVRWKDY